MPNEIESIIRDFAAKLTQLIEAATLAKARVALEQNLGIRPPRNGTSKPAKLGRPRRKGPVQLCPVPGCKNKAAPVFGMVCKDHKDVPKAKIKKYREARKKQKASGVPF